MVLNEYRWTNGTLFTHRMLICCCQFIYRWCLYIFHFDVGYLFSNDFGIDVIRNANGSCFPPTADLRALDERVVASLRHALGCASWFGKGARLLQTRARCSGSVRRIRVVSKGNAPRAFARNVRVRRLAATETSATRRTVASCLHVRSCIYPVQYMRKRRLSVKLCE